MEVGTHKLLVYAAGVLEGPMQTVTRAELTAFVQAIRSAPQGQNLTIISDSAYVVNEYAKLRDGQMPMKHRDLWSQVKRQILWTKGYREIRCVKVKAHTTEEDLKTGKYGITEYTREGNRLADMAANDAADMAAIDQCLVDRVRAADAEAFVVLRRLVAVNMHCVGLDIERRQQHDEARITLHDKRLGTAVYAEYLKAASHKVVALSDGWRCSICRSFTIKANLQEWCETPCSKVISDVKGTRMGRGTVHYTHNLRHTRGVLWCRMCGFHSIRRCDKLSKKCLCTGLIRQPTMAGHETIRRMSIGMLPVGLQAWPDLEQQRTTTWFRTWLGKKMWCAGDVRPHGYPY